MNISVIAVGKKHDKKLVSVIEDYTTRLNHYTKMEWNLVEAKVSPSLKAEQTKEVESAVILNHINDQDTVVLLDEHGTELASLDLANRIQSYKNSSVKHLVFIIGGAFGVSNDVMQRADFIWCLSKLVLPHQLVRVVLAEQLYRAHTILAGEKYHHP